MPPALARFCVVFGAVVTVIRASGDADDIADEVCKNFVDNDGSFPYEEYKEGEVQKVWSACYGAPALGACADCYEEACCNFSQFELDCSGDCRTAALNAIHDRCWYRFDLDDEPATPEQCEEGTVCEEPLYAYRKAVDDARRHCLRPRWGYLFLLIFCSMAAAVVMLGTVGYTAKKIMERVHRRKAE